MQMTTFKYLNMEFTYSSDVEAIALLHNYITCLQPIETGNKALQLYGVFKLVTTLCQTRYNFHIHRNRLSERY